MSTYSFARLLEADERAVIAAEVEEDGSYHGARGSSTRRGMSAVAALTMATAAFAGHAIVKARSSKPAAVAGSGEDSVGLFGLPPKLQGLVNNLHLPWQQQPQPALYHPPFGQPGGMPVAQGQPQFPQQVPQQQVPQQQLPQQQFPQQQPQQPFPQPQQPPPQQPQQPAAPATSTGCFAKNNYNYNLDWKAEGAGFFQEWNYLQNEPNSGAAEYVQGPEAQQSGMVQALGNVAVIKPGGPGNAPLKRKSVKLETQRKWTYFLMAMKYEAIPWGCGVWPALWTHSPDAGWPAGGELDILEYSNEITSRTSLHTAESNRCKLNRALLNKPGCPALVDAEYDFTGDYQCVTDYPDKIGCAPNDRSKMLNGEQMSNEPGVVAVEWTPDFVKTFRIPASQMPQDLAMDAPKPDNWDQFVTGYYPFAESEQTIPGSCPNPAGVLKAQQIVLSLGFCGDWASKVYSNSTCANKGYPSNSPWTSKGPTMGSECVAVDPHNPMGEQPAGPRDCCTNFIADPQGQFGTQQYLDEHGAWKINWLKVYQSQQAR